jgi:hypothetical protein
MTNVKLSKNKFLDKEIENKNKNKNAIHMDL